MEAPFDEDRAMPAGLDEREVTVCESVGISEANNLEAFIGKTFLGKSKYKSERKRKLAEDL